MNLVDLVALTLAIGGLVDCWMNGSIFKGPRKKLEKYTLFGCDYCENWQAPIWLILLFYLPSLWLPHPWDVVDKLPLYWLAAAFAAWLINEHRAKSENDYRRTVRAEEDMKNYGGQGEKPTIEPMGETYGDQPSRQVPALFPTDGSEATYYCTSGCQAHAAIQADENNVRYTMGAGTVSRGAKCAYCNKTLL